MLFVVWAGGSRWSHILQVEVQFYTISKERNLRLFHQTGKCFDPDTPPAETVSYISRTDSQMQPLTPSLLTTSSKKSHWMGTVFTQWKTEATTYLTKSPLLILARIFLTAGSLSLGSHASQHTQLSDLTAQHH